MPLRIRSHLTEAEVNKLLKVAKGGRHGIRDHLMVLMAFRHGLRVSELIDLKWSENRLQGWNDPHPAPERLQGLDPLPRGGMSSGR